MKNLIKYMLASFLLFEECNNCSITNEIFLPHYYVFIFPSTLDVPEDSIDIHVGLQMVDNPWPDQPRVILSDTGIAAVESSAKGVFGLADLWDWYGPLPTICGAMYRTKRERLQNEFNVKVFANDDSAWGTIKIPDSLTIISPLNGSVISKQNDLTIKWHCNADFYYVDPRYWSQLNLLDSFDLGWVKSDSVVINSRYLPDSGTITIRILAYNGAFPLQRICNMQTTSGYGFIASTNNSDDLVEVSIK